MFFGNSKLDKLEEFLEQLTELMNGKRNILTLPEVEGSDKVSDLLRKLEKAAEIYINKTQQDMKVTGEMVLLTIVTGKQIGRAHV